MQDLRSIPGAATGRLFGALAGEEAAGGGALDRRLRPHPPQQSLRCPRCDSLNTKFCYYNNYNLSQPRHFCKSCRRYWTKGGVLRNVPVGGGCRKSKRSSSSKPSKSSSSTASPSRGCKDHPRASPATAAPSSSDSSSLTANAADPLTVTQEPTSPPPPAALDSYTTSLLDSIHEGAAPPAVTGIFPETGSFTSFIAAAAAAAANPDVMGLNFATSPQLHLLPLQQPKAAPPPQPRAAVTEEEIRLPGMAADGYMDHMAHMDVLLPPTQGRPAAGPPLAAFDWPGGVDMPAGLFDAAATSVVGDHGGFWNHSQWGEIDPSLFLP